MRSCIALAPALLLLAAGPAAAVVQWVEAIAQEGEPAPGTGGSFASFGAAVQHENGDVAFTAQVSGGSAAEGIFLLPFGGALAPVVLAGDASPFPGQDYAAFPDAVDLIMGDSEAVVAFHAILSQSPLHEGIAVAQGGAHTAVVELLDPAPGAGGFLHDFGPPSLCRFCDPLVLAFRAEISSGSSTGGIFLYEEGAGLSEVVLAGDPAPGVPGGSFVSFGDPDLLTETIHFPAVVDVSGQTRSGVFRGVAGALELVALEGEPSPDGPAYGPFGTDSVEATSSSGTYFSDGSALYSDGFVDETLARVGDPAPDTGGSYAAFPFAPSCCISSGSVHYADVVGSTTSGGFFPTSLPAHGTYARLGDPAPDTGAGTFSDFPFPPSANLGADAGTVLSFTALVAGGTASGGVFRLPEPGVGIGLLAGGALLGMLGRRRRRRCD